MPPRPPESAQQIVLAGQRVAYALRRSSRRSIGLRIDQRGLCVAAPLRTSLHDVETLIRAHGQWVLDKLAAWREQPPPARLEAAEGSRIFVLERPLTVKLTAAARARWQFAGEEIRLSVPPTVAPAKVLETALREHARAHFLERLATYAPRLGVAVPPLRLSSARTRWGSCSARGGIALNWRLVLLPPAIVDYVVCHELAHLKEMNHSPRFWSVVEQLCPDWRRLRLDLRRLGRQLPLI